MAAGFREGAYRATLSDGDAAGGVLALPNPEGTDIYVTRVILNVTKAATSAGTVDAGIAADATTSADNLIDGLDVNAATGVFDNLINGGTNGKAGRTWGTSQYLTISKATGSVAGLKGEAIIQYIRL